MIKNYIKIAWRNIWKNKVYSFINIFGLALGMAITIMIGLWIADELTYNSYFKNKKTIAHVYQTQTHNGTANTDPAIPLALEGALRTKYGDNFKYIVMSSWTNTRNLNYEDKTISRDGNFMQKDAPNLLSLEMVKGKYNGLQDVNSIMISASTAKILFGNTDPMGKIIVTDNKYNMRITGIYKDIPENNDFNDVKFIMPWQHYLNTKWDWLEDSANNWDYNTFQMFVQITDQASMQSVSNKIKNSKKDIGGEIARFNPELMLLPMKDWYLRSKFENGVQAGGRIENIWLLGIIGSFILFLACINFMNLSTARSEKRAMEVGIRKTIGSSRKQLIFQFLSESFLMVLLSYILALLITFLTLDSFSNLAKKEIDFPWVSHSFWAISILFIGFTALISGSYPALYLSSFKPIKILKGTFKTGRFAVLSRRTLVVAQFTVSIALIIGTLVVVNQIQYSKDRSVGYDNSGLLQIPTASSEFQGKYDIMRQILLSSNAVTEMSWSTSPTTDIWNNSSGYTWKGKPEGFQENFAITGVSYDYVKSLGMKIISGRDFSRKFASDSNAILLNRTAVKYMGITEPVGKFISSEDDDGQKTSFKIVGIVEDMVVQSPYEPVKPQLFELAQGVGGYYNLRLNPDQPVRESLASIKRIFNEIFPDLPFQYDFIDQEYAKKFAAEERISSLAKVFSVLAILINCLGLFGLASFMAEQRTKEIGVRKVLGATVINLCLLMSKDFVILVCISLLISSPLAYYFMSNWIQQFSYRTDISFWIFIAAALGALLITLLTVSFQAIKAAVANPVKSLRSE